MLIYDSPSLKSPEHLKDEGYASFHDTLSLSYTPFFKIFDSKMQPILLYQSEIWDYKDLRILKLDSTLYGCSGGGG